MKSVQEPPAAPFDLCSQAFKRNPFPTLAAMRESGPVIRVRIPLFGTVWMATTHAAVNDLLRDHHRFVQSPADNRWMAAIFRLLPGTLRPLASNMLLRDEPDHRRLRGLVNQAFQRQRSRPCGRAWKPWLTRHSTGSPRRRPARPAEST
jgi:cytochrome P450